jgi:electron transfer flavoprotein-quinone oxidoreductase
MSHRMQRQYPTIACNIVESMFTVTNPTPKPGAMKIAWREVRRAKLRLRDLAHDAWVTTKTFG